MSALGDERAFGNRMKEQAARNAQISEEWRERAQKAEAQLEKARERIIGLEAAYEVQREAAGWLMGMRFGR